MYIYIYMHLYSVSYCHYYYRSGAALFLPRFLRSVLQLWPRTRQRIVSNTHNLPIKIIPAKIR